MAAAGLIKAKKGKDGDDKKKKSKDAAVKKPVGSQSVAKKAKKDTEKMTKKVGVLLYEGIRSSFTLSNIHHHRQHLHDHVIIQMQSHAPRSTSV